MALLLLVFSVFAVADGLAADSSFEHYVKAFGRGYAAGSPEYNERKDLFHRRQAAIAEQNSRPGRLWTAGLNEFTDRTSKELARYRGWRHVESPGSDRALLLEESVELIAEPPESVDWTNLTMAADVPDQGGCGSCWAVATASMLHARSEAQRGDTKTTFSAQQLVNCVPNPRSCGGEGGCQGATVELAMAYVEKVGLEGDTKVPYHGEDLTCEQPLETKQPMSFLQQKRARGSALIGLDSWTTLAKNKAKPLMAAVAEGPVAISVAASPWFLYQEGIFNGCDQDAVIDHAVTLFGYGKDGDQKYWLIRNSWGGGWGEKGYIRLFRHNTAEEDDKFCGTDHDPGVGIECKPYPKTVQVCGMCGMLYDSVAAHFSPVMQL